jgi:hypothetical protein
MNYESVKELFETARLSANGKPIARNTRIFERQNNDYAIRYHETDIMTFRNNGEVVLNSGGWRTYSTKERLNRFMPEGKQIFQVSGIWYITDGTRKVAFEDGMTLNHVGEINFRVSSLDLEQAQKDIQKKINKYIKGFVESVKDGLKDPSSGDCWECSMINIITGKQAFQGMSHFLSHFEEGYYVPSLLVNAMNENVYGNPGFVWEMMKSDPKFRKSEVAACLRQYFKKRRFALANLLMEQKP